MLVYVFLLLVEFCTYENTQSIVQDASNTTAVVAPVIYIDSMVPVHFKLW